MADLTREALAYALIGTMILIGVPLLTIAWRRRQRRLLRQRGIKRYGH